MIDFYISLKIALAMLITAIPLFIIFFVKPRLKKEEGWKNSFDFAQKHKGFFRVLKKKLVLFCVSFRNGLGCNKSIRKMYLLMILILMLAVETVDTNVSHYIAKFVMTAAQKDAGAYAKYEYLAPMLTHPAATVMSFFLTFLMLSYRIGNWILTRLHNDDGNFLLLSLLSVAFCYPFGGKTILLGEIFFILTFASYFYPNMEVVSETAKKKDDGDKGRKRKDKRKNRR